MLDFTVLNIDNILGKNQLEIFKKYGTKCTATDFAILLGCNVSSENFTNEGNELKDRTCPYWTKTPYDNDGYGSGWINSIDINGYEYMIKAISCNIGVRPAVAFSSLKKFSSNEKINLLNIKEVEYGEYPQSIVFEKESNELEEIYNDGIYDDNILKPTGKKYTVYYDKTYSTITEYEYKNKKYIRLIGNTYVNEPLLSNGRKIILNQPYWIMVEPIVFLVDEETNTAISKKILFSGLEFNTEKIYNNNFEFTTLKKFMNNCFTNEIIPSNIIKIKEIDENILIIKKSELIDEIKYLRQELEEQIRINQQLSKENNVIIKLKK